MLYTHTHTLTHKDMLRSNTFILYA